MIKNQIRYIILIFRIIFSFLNIGTLFLSIFGVSCSAFLLKFCNIQSKNDLLNYRFVFSGGALGASIALSVLNPLAGVFPLLVWIWNIYYSYSLINENNLNNNILNYSTNSINKENNENQTLNNLNYLRHYNIINDLNYNYLLSKIFSYKEQEKDFNEAVVILKKLINLNNNNEIEENKQYFHKIINNIVSKIEIKESNISEQLKNSLQIFSLSK